MYQTHSEPPATDPGYLRVYQRPPIADLGESLNQLRPAIKQNVILNRGEMLFAAGDALQAFYAVRSGSLKVYGLGDCGGEQVLGFYFPGDLLGLEATETQFHGCSVVALETSCLCELPVALLDSLSRGCAVIQQQLNRWYRREIARDYALLRILTQRSAERRLAAFLIDLSARFAERGFSEQEFNLSMSRYDIGSYLGLAAETVSRLFSRFQEQDMLRVAKRHVRILALDQLKQLAGAATVN